MLIDELVEVAARVANIIRIARITFKLHLFVY